MLLVAIGLASPQAAKEFETKYVSLVSAALIGGLLLGAVICGMLGDIVGRRIIWQLSLVSTTIWTLICAGAPNFGALCAFVLLQAVGGGGGCK